MLIASLNECPNDFSIAIIDVPYVTLGHQRLKKHRFLNLDKLQNNVCDD